ncbi:hypothetical protein AWB74_04243 [Caballeronia arvi]|uniref:Uncharacterized protein n=1 Tax=Caballeronia arvi TaxID=1777135 RepID=A0A158JSN1_9BURK|nr:hypothetical protein AWB74_04243 [Caballeronia arvi]
MLEASLRSNGRIGLRIYADMVAKPAIAISIVYCALSNISFQTAADGSFSMSRASEVGLVSVHYAEQHATDAVLFKRVGPTLFEYRVRRPLVGYAGIPWLVARRTEIDLARHCEDLSHEGCTLDAN